MTRELPDHESSTSELRARVALTRERVVDDLEALGDKLSADNIKAEAKQAIVSTVHDGLTEVRARVARAASVVSFVVRRHPVPVGLLAVVLGLSLWRARRA